MSYQEKNIIVSLFTTLLIFGFYAVNVFQMYQAESVNATDLYSLWATIIVLSIVVNIVASVLTQVIFSVIQILRTQEEEAFIEDERDQLINLKGTRNSYAVAGVGIFIAMLTLVVGMSPLVMFNLLVFFLILAEIIGDLSRLYLYRRGV